MAIGTTLHDDRPTPKSRTRRASVAVLARRDAAVMTMRRPSLAALVATIALAAAGTAHGAVPAGADRVTQLPTLGPVTQPQFAGYASTQRPSCVDLACTDRPGLFYWLAGQSAGYRTQPTVLWSNGGPGSSSFYGFLSENGPYTVTPSGTLAPDSGSWTSVANYLFFDQPFGVGMSFPFQGQVAQNLRQGTRQWANAVAHVVHRDELERSPLFLTGESYGGTYMPLLARRLLKAHPDVRVGGVVLVAGWVDPKLQVGTTARYALTHGLIDRSQKRRLDRVYRRCRAALRKNVDSLRAGSICQSIQDKIAAWSGRYLANIAQTGDIDYGPIEAYLNRPDVRTAIHARQDPKFTLSSDSIYKQYARGIMRNYAPVVGKLLDSGIPVMVISGLNDGKDTNFLAAHKWISKLSWKKAGRYRRAGTEKWEAGGSVLGYRRRGGGLTSLNVLNAGHLAPRDQPRIADALKQFMAAATRRAGGRR
jgi:vitellogenic carboxypeptidase-like protein